MLTISDFAPISLHYPVCSNYGHIIIGRVKQIYLQQLQMSCNLINYALGPRPHTQYRRGPTCYLCPTCIMDDLRAQSQTYSLCL